MELLACKRAAQLADEVNAAHIHIKMDCKEIVRKLQNLSWQGPLVQDVKHLMEARQSWKVSWVRRSANLGGVMNNLCKVWLHQPPDCIHDVIAAEIPAFYE